MCGWCGSDCGGEGEVLYGGSVLGVPTEQGWWLFPSEGFRGAAGILVTSAALSGLALGCAWVAEVVLVAEEHPDSSGTAPGLDVQVFSPLITPVQVKNVKWVSGHWRGSVNGVSRDFAALLDASDRDSQVLQKAPMWAWSATSGEPHWTFEDVDGYLREHRRQAPDDPEYAAWVRKRSRSAEDHVDPFVNPYAFVPLGSGARHSRPSGHLGLAEARVSGRVTVTATACSELALPGQLVNGVTEPVTVEGRFILPGSALAGAVRSFHEALTGSCLRVVNADFVPIHRDPAAVHSPGRWRMAVVEEPGNEVRLCDPVRVPQGDFAAIWVEARDIHSVGDVLSSHRFHYSPLPADIAHHTARGRVERVGGAIPQLCTSAECQQAHWRTIVTQALGNRVLCPGPRQHPYHLPFACESLTTLPLDERVLADYVTAAHGAGDVVRTRRSDLVQAAVTGVGHRQITTETLQPGRVVWVQVENDRVMRVSLSVLWRSRGRYNVAERAPAHLPCTDPQTLCPSCALFGMAEERETRDTRGAARVAAYRGHVRFGHATVSEVAPDATTLREMGSPRPSAGQFYLNNERWKNKQALPGQRPLREWGSAADHPVARGVAGRKFFWSSTTTQRHVDVNGNPNMISHHRLVPVGATLTFRVWFDNLTTVQLGSLLVSLDPNLLRHHRVQAVLTPMSHAMRAALGMPLALHLGKGKGWGLGTVTPSLQAVQPVESQDAPVDRAKQSLEIEIWDADRYRVPAEELSVQDALGAVEEFVRLADRETWAPLLAMSAVDWVPPERIAYPPDDQPGADFGFDFWKRSTGAPGTTKVPGDDNYQPKLIGLPRPDDTDVYVRRPWLEDT